MKDLICSEELQERAAYDLLAAGWSEGDIAKLVRHRAIDVARHQLWVDNRELDPDVRGFSCDCHLGLDEKVRGRDALSLKTCCLQINVRPKRILDEAGCENIGDVVRITPEQFLRLPGCGPVCVSEISKALMDRDIIWPVAYGTNPRVFETRFIQF